jgi:hypothetical protein
MDGVDAAAWDELLARHGGSFFQTHAYFCYGSRGRNDSPLFLRILGPGGECAGIAAATCTTPRRWPLSRYCKEAVLNCLPAVPGPDPDAQVEALAAVEQALARRGVYRVRVAALDSPHSDAVLSRLGYALDERYDFYMDLCRDSEAVWQKVRSERRTIIRKAIKSGVQTREQNDEAGLKALWGLHADAMGRRGISTAHIDDSARAMKRLLLDTGRARLLIDYLDGAPASAIMFGVFGERACTFLAGSSVAGNKLGAPAHVYWALIELLCKEGVPRVNLGGVAARADATGEVKDGLFAFKKNFGATPVRQSAGTKILTRTGAALARLRDALKRRVTPPPSKEAGG